MDLNNTYSGELCTLQETSLTKLQDQIHVLKRQLQEKEDTIMTLTADTKGLSCWNKAKQDGRDAERRYEEFVSRLANRLGPGLPGSEDPPELLSYLVDALFEEKGRRASEVRGLRESVAAGELECRASRHTVMRLVAEVQREQRVVAARAAELDTLKQELDRALLAKRRLEAENKTLKESLEGGHHALTQSQQEATRLEGHSRELAGSLHRGQIEAQAVRAALRAFREEVEALTYESHDVAPRTEEAILKRVREVCSSEDAGTEVWLTKRTQEAGAGVSDVLGELARLLGIHQVALQRARSAEQRAQELAGRQTELEAELLSSDVLRDGLSRDSRNTQRFLEQLSEKMKLDKVTADVGFDMRLEAILSRAEQLVKHEDGALVESKSLAYSLQRKLKAQRDRLESKELHIDMLRRKLAQLEEEKRGRSALTLERDDACLAAKKLQKKAERLQRELEASRLSNTELRAQLSHTNELKVKVLEQSQSIEDQSKRLDRLQKEKDKVAEKLASERSELQSRHEQARAAQQQAQRAFESQSGELRTLQQTMQELGDRERQLLDFRKVVSQMLGLDISTLALPDYEIIKALEGVLHTSHHAVRPWAYLAHQHHQVT